MTILSPDAIATEIIYKSFNNRDAYTCDHCERQYDDSICDTCFRVMLHSKVKEAIQAERTRKP